jgi:Uma2 family endonuclease
MGLDVQSAPSWLALVLLAEDDTEESVMGSDLHQQAIGESYAPLFEYAQALGSEAEPAWYVSSQVTVILSIAGREQPWQPKPDVFVVPGVPAHPRTSYDTRTEGPAPAFVLEVASESTWRRDVGQKHGLYGLVGVREYLVYDPTGAFLGEQVRAWHRVGAAWEPWQATVRGDGMPVWESAVLGLAARPEGVLLRFDHPTRGTLPVRRELVLALAREQRARRVAEQEAAAARTARLAAEQEKTEERAARLAAEDRAALRERELAAARAEIERLRAERGTPP